MKEISNQTIDLVVTSPPYPMIKMWDDVFSQINPLIKELLEKQEGMNAFELMHKELDKIWKEIVRVTKPGSFVCINIGDATRTIGGEFQLFPSHARIIDFFTKNNFVLLPSIIWRKPTNSPNKFMGSGMLPAGAYVTLEHEYILIFRKKGKRTFTKEEKIRRRESAYFWEERNQWFSDVWEFPGINQQLNNLHLRERSAAYPFDLAYRLINMYSIKGDWVLDPFLGTGTTTLAAIVSGRNSYGYEIDVNFESIIKKRIKNAKAFGNELISQRLHQHIDFIKQRISNKSNVKYTSKIYSFPVVTSQETDICLNFINEIKMTDKNVYQVDYNETTFFNETIVVSKKTLKDFI